MPRKKDAATELAEKMLQALDAQRRLGAEAYPLAVRRLAQLTDSAAPDELVLKAVAKKKVFAPRAVVAQARNLDSPIALAEDADRLAGSPLLLEFLLEQVCTRDRPTCPIKNLKSKLVASLRAPFEAALDRQVRDHTLPATVAVVTVKKKQELHFLRYPIPRAPEVVLAENLVQVLRSQRTLGGDSYPLSLSRLVELTQPGADAALRKKAFAQPTFKDQVVLALQKAADTPLALAEDDELLASSALLWHTLLHLVRSEQEQAFDGTALEKSLTPALRRSFHQALGHRIDSRSMPPGIGFLLHKKKPVVFLLQDVERNAGRTTGSPASPTPEAVPAGGQDFARAFDTAFDRLDRQAGVHNLVSLVELRRAVPSDRNTFDAELRRLRMAGRYTLKLAEGRHGISPEEQAAGIQEDGNLLLYVSRKMA
jgi:hypothetical protein